MNTFSPDVSIIIEKQMTVNPNIKERLDFTTRRKAQTIVRFLLSAENMTAQYAS
jgi:hypothetical protein